MSSLTYTRYELLRLFRNRQSLIFSLLFPLVMYFVLAAPNKNDHNFGGSKQHPTGLFAPQYYMVGLLGLRRDGGGALGRSPHRGRAHGRLEPAVATHAADAAQLSAHEDAHELPDGDRRHRPALCRRHLASACRLTFGEWVEMTAATCSIALVPFAVLGIAVGHLLNDDAVGPAIGGGVGLFAFLGGTWFPITGSGVFTQFCQLLPSYWLVQAGHVGLGAGNPWGVKGWVVIAAWTVAGAVFAMWAYRRDTRKV